MMISALVVAFILLAGYWFGFREGFFSGVIHLACAIVAGAVTFAFWEPLAVLMLPTGMAEFAWGMSFLSLFGITLIVLRILANYAVPDRQNYPPMVDYIAGSVVGLIIGVLTAGMGLLGIGFLPVGNELGGSLGALRTTDEHGQPGYAGSITPPAHKWVESFYAMLSSGAFRPLVNSHTLAAYYPSLAEQSWTLQRDTASRGRIKLTLAPEDVQIGTPYIGSLPGTTVDYYVVPVTFSKGAYHGGDYFVLSASQARLIGRPTGTAAPKEVFPEAWKQGSATFRFDDLSHYIINPPAQQSIQTLLIFPKAGLGGQIPKAIMIRGTRFALARPMDTPQDLDTGGPDIASLVDPSAPMVPEPYISLGNHLGVEFSKNTKPPGLYIDPETLGVVSGFGTVPTLPHGRISRSLRVNSLYQPPDTQIVRVDVSRGRSPIDIWGDKSDARTKEGNSAALILIDDRGTVYLPRGFLHRREGARLIVIELNATDGIKTINDIPSLSTAGKDKLEIIYLVPEGRSIIGMKLGETTVARFRFKASR
jgi:hypothetical protein